MGNDDDDRKVVNMPAPENLQEAGLVILALIGGVDHLLDGLAAANGNTDGPWLDEIKQVIIKNAKGTVTESISIGTEAAGMKMGVDLLDVLVERLRRRLVREQK